MTLSDGVTFSSTSCLIGLCGIWDPNAGKLKIMPSWSKNKEFYNPDRKLSQKWFWSKKYKIILIFICLLLAVLTNNHQNAVVKILNIKLSVGVNVFFMLSACVLLNKWRVRWWGSYCLLYSPCTLPLHAVPASCPLPACFLCASGAQAAMQLLTCIVGYSLHKYNWRMSAKFQSQELVISDKVSQSFDTEKNISFSNFINLWTWLCTLIC